jgi:DNA-binding NtrC family response regulator
MKKSVMFFDDSASVIESLRWVFMDEPYYLFAYEDPLEALSIINTLEFAVVVAEHSMKKMDGIELLKKIKNKSPCTMGIIMSGYTEFKQALNIIYPGCVYRYVKKPLNSHEIRHAVKSAITLYETNTKNKIGEIAILPHRTEFSYQ